MIIRNNNIKIAPLKQNEPQSNITQKPTQDVSFEKLLNQKINENESIKFSKHAEQRLKTRNIELSGQQKERLNEGVKRAEEKGIKDSLVLCDNMAFVVSVKNKTVVTALNGSELRNNVFTNIDGAVIV